MATEIDSLEITIESNIKPVSSRIDEICDKLDVLAGKISAIGKISGFEKLADRAKEVTNGLGSIQNAAKNISANMEPQMQKAAKSFEELSAKFKGLGKDFTFKGSASEIQKQMEKYENALETARLKKEELEAAGKTDGKMYEAAIAGTIKYTNIIDSLKQQLEGMQAVQPQLNIDFSRFEEAQQAVSGMSGALREAVSIPASSMNYNPDAMAAVFGEAARNIENYGQAVERFGKNAGMAMNDAVQLNVNLGGLEEAQQNVSNLSSELQNMGEVLRRTFTVSNVINAFRASLSGIGKAADAAVNAVSKVTRTVYKLASKAKAAASKFSGMMKSFAGLNGTGKSLNTTFSGGLRTLLKYSLGIRSLYAFFNKLRNAFKEGMKNLVQYSSRTNASVSMLKNSITQLKNSVAAAAAPLVNALAPALNTIIQVCVKATNSINQLISSLTGNGTWIRAKTLTDDYAESIRKAGKAAKGALQPFDELNVITTQSGSGSGTETDPTDMFETLEVESSFKSLAERIKQMWADSDFAELGAVLGKKLQAAFNGINWKSIQGTARKFGTSIGTLINGSIEVDGLADSIGRTIGEVINTGITGISAFLDKTRWNSVGVFLGKGLSGIIDSVDWKGLGHLFASEINAIFGTISNFSVTFNWSELGTSLSNGLVTFIHDFDIAAIGSSIGETVKGLLDTFIAFVEETNWRELGNTLVQKMVKFATAIDWTGFYERLYEGIGAAIGGIGAFLWGLIEAEWNLVVGWWKEIAFEDGQFTMEGLLDGITEGIKNIGTWIYEHIFRPFIDGFKKAFGIASPSRVMKEQGEYIISGLLKGLKDNINSVWEWISKVPEKMTGFFKDIPNDFLEIGGNIISGLWDGIKSTWDNVSGGIKEIGSGIINTFKNIFDIHSPSKVMFKLGDYTMQGLQLGLENLQQPILRSMKDFSYDLQITPAPVPSLAGMYVNYQYNVGAYVTHSNNSEMEGMVERIAYRVLYNAVSSAITNNKLLNDQKEIIEDIFNKPILGDGDIFSATQRGYRQEATRRYGNSAAIDPILG